MKTANLFMSVLMATGALVSFSNMANAGEGGVAGSVSVIMSGGEITNLSAAAAVGKLNAASATNTSATETFASAFGSAGTLTVTGAGSTITDTGTGTTTTTTGTKYEGAADANLGTAQNNTFSTTSLTKIEAKAGTVTIP
jgi:hypothetical protein